MSSAAIKPLERTGSSANIVYYRERGGPVWASVLHSLPWVRDAKGKITGTGKGPGVFYLTIYRGDEQVAELTYKPKTKPPDGELPARTVTRLVREAFLDNYGYWRKVLA